MSHKYMPNIILLKKPTAHTYSCIHSISNGVKS